MDAEVGNFSLASPRSLSLGGIMLRRSSGFPCGITTTPEQRLASSSRSRHVFAASITLCAYAIQLHSYLCAVRNHQSR